MLLTRATGRTSRCLRYCVPLALSGSRSLPRKSPRSSVEMRIHDGLPMSGILPSHMQDILSSPMVGILPPHLGSRMTLPHTYGIREYDQLKQTCTMIERDDLRGSCWWYKKID